jgi:hypothetical protein
MATSLSTNWALTADGIVRSMFRLLGKRNLHADTTYFSEALDALNGMVRAWQREGLFLWLHRDITVFLENGKKYYSIGPSGDHAAIDPVKTELASAGTTGDLTITVDSSTGISTTNAIGIEKDDGALFWTTVNGAPVGNVVTLTAALDGAAAVDNHVYAYSTIPPRPVQLSDSIRLINEDESEQLITLVSRREFAEIPDKADTGECIMAYADMRTTNIRLYVWPTCDNVKQRIVFSAAIPMDDFDAAANDADFPPEWLRALRFNLAVEFAPELDVEVPQTVLRTAIESKAMIAGNEAEPASIFLLAEFEME